MQQTKVSCTPLPAMADLGGGGKKKKKGLMVRNKISKT